MFRYVIHTVFMPSKQPGPQTGKPSSEKFRFVEFLRHKFSEFLHCFTSSLRHLFNIYYPYIICWAQVYNAPTVLISTVRGLSFCCAYTTMCMYIHLWPKAACYRIYPDHLLSESPPMGERREIAACVYNKYRQSCCLHALSTVHPPLSTGADGETREKNSSKMADHQIGFPF